MSRYAEWLLAQGLDPSTVTIYEGKLVRAEAIATEQSWDLRYMTATQLGCLAARFPYSSSTQTILRSALTHYWAMCGVDNPARAIRSPKPPPFRYRGLEPDESARLVSASKGWWPHGTAVLLGLYLALRRREIATLRWEQFEDGWVTIMGKGSRTRHLPVHQCLREVLEPRESVGYLFPGRGAHPCVHCGTVRTWVGLVSVTAGLGYLSPHQLRHTCLAEMHEQTGDLRITQYFAGHADPSTTARYTRATKRALVAAVDTLYRPAA